MGYDDVERVFILRNSWGDWWGHGGYCYASYDYVASPDFNLEMCVRCLPLPAMRCAACLQRSWHAPLHAVFD